MNSLGHICGRRIGVVALVPCLAISALLAAVNVVSAEGLRIETRIFAGKEGKVKEPVSTATTLFLNGTVYDFLSDPAQIAVFHKPPGDKPGRFILLDPERCLLQAYSSLRASQRLRALSRLNTPSRPSCPIPIALSKAGRPCRRA